MKIVFLKSLNSKFSLFILLTVLFAGITACDFPEHYFESKPECYNEVEFFKTADSNTPAYRAKVMEILRQSKPDQFRYFFKTFVEGSRKTYMLTNFRNEQHCFDVKMLVSDWSKLAGMRRTNGKSYPNELYDLTWTIDKIEGGYEVHYFDMHRIID